MVAVTEGLGCSVAGGPAVHPVNGPNPVYRVTIYEGIITGKLRRAIRIMEVDLGLYRSLCDYTDIEDGFYLGQLDGLVALVARKRKLLALLDVINSVYLITI